MPKGHIASSEPPAVPPQFLVGQDEEGHWLALETHNLAGGIFKSQQDALHFASRETDGRPGCVRLCGSPLKLRF